MKKETSKICRTAQRCEWCYLVLANRRAKNPFPEGYFSNERCANRHRYLYTRQWLLTDRLWPFYLPLAHRCLPGVVLIRDASRYNDISPAIRPRSSWDSDTEAGPHGVSCAHVSRRPNSDWRECGLHKARWNNALPIPATNSSTSDFVVFPGSPTKCCFSAMSRSTKFIGTHTSNFISMVISEVIIISSTLTRLSKFFRYSSELSNKWLRQKPSQLCKYIARKLEVRFKDSNSTLMRSIYFFSHCAIARVVYDCANSILWEVCPLKSRLLMFELTNM